MGVLLGFLGVVMDGFFFSLFIYLFISASLPACLFMAVYVFQRSRLRIEGCRLVTEIL